MKALKPFGFLILLALSFVLFLPLSNTFAESNKVYHVPVEEKVEKGLYVFLKNAIKEAENNHAQAIVLDIHTPGGYVDAADSIGKALQATEIPVIAYINTKAHSAGAYIALNADAIYMKPNATIGSAGVIDENGNAASEKAQSAWRAEMEAAALSMKRDPSYALGMANPDLDFTNLGAPVGDYLTLTAQSALNVGYSEGTVNSIEEALALEGFKNVELIDYNPTLAVNIARFTTDPVIVPILLSIATTALMIELFSPGVGVSGLISLTSFGLFFYGHLIAGFAGYESFIIFAIGLILLVIELVVPGGLIGLIGIALVILSLLFAGESVTHMAYSICIAIIIALLGMVVLMKFFGKKLHVFNKLVLSDATTSEEGYVSNENRIELIGKYGKTLTPLRPAGVVEVNEERLDVVSEGLFIDAHTNVQVIKVEGSRIVVREMKMKTEE